MQASSGEKGPEADGFGEAAAALAVLGAEALHEITHTLNFLRFLTQPPLGDVSEAESARFAQTELERLQRLITHLRRFKLPTPQLEDVRLALLVMECVEQARGAWEVRGIRVEAALPADCAVQADTRCLRAALGHLIHYVVEQAPAGSRLLITAPDSDRQPVQLEFSVEGTVRSTDGRDAPPWWELWPLETAPSRRLLGHKLLRHIGWSLSESPPPSPFVLRLIAPPPVKPLP